MRRELPIVAFGVIALCVMFAVSLLAGRVWLDPREIFSGLTSDSELAGLIVTELRIPRALLGMLVGAALGLSGAVLQGLTRNPLAEPGLLGVSAGAALGAVIAIYFGIALLIPFALPVFGLLGALAATSITFALGRGGGTLALILAGTAVTGLAAALTSLAISLAPNASGAYEIMTWVMGSLADRSWDHIWLAGPFIIIGSLLLASTARAIDALSLGEAQAQSLGVDLDRLRTTILIGTSMAIGAATSVTGAIGFIGLVAPHLVRPLVGHQPSRILLPAALCGAVLLLGADVVTRLLHFGPEMKLGVFTSLLGVPFFFWLIVRLRGTAP
jgi:iron complex transport system permease protein